MKKRIFSALAILFGRNLNSTPVEVISDQLKEPRPLPMGRQEFEEWSDRIIAGTMLSGGEENKQVFIEGQKFALANMLLHLGPTESHKPDAFFVHSLRKFAVNQVADSVAREIRDAAKKRLAVEEAAKKLMEEQEADSDEPITAASLIEAQPQQVN